MIIPFLTGQDPVAGYGQKHHVQFTGTFETISLWTLWLGTSAGDFAFGRGWIGGSIPDVALTFGDRMYVGGNNLLNFSANGDVTGWNEQNVGAGYILVQQQQGLSDVIKALSHFQGRIVIFGRQSIQIWSVDADPSQFLRIQVMQNIGTIATHSVQAIGDLDVYFLDRTGFRSLRARETSLNAIPDDIGAAIDLLVQEKIDDAGSEAINACAIVEPVNKRYWCFVDDTIFVLSHFPASKVSAWSTYRPEWDYNGEPVPFTPEKFVVFDGEVYCRSVERDLLEYGGGTYDSSVVTAEVWSDAKTPENEKSWMGLSVGAEGAWLVKATATLKGDLEEIARFGSLTTVDELEDSLFDKKRVSFSMVGSHLRVQFTSLGNDDPAKISSLYLKYNTGEVQ